MVLWTVLDVVLWIAPDVVSGKRLAFSGELFPYKFATPGSHWYCRRALLYLLFYTKSVKIAIASAIF
ncbi:hypothetical protein VB620_06855 [Nodularia harveyana UHCC-0300]|uniref:Uncharacterized protein n=1 Tax=Nodularia harveyana UHCC-0300 TaxID=2974287 RepID=A0ABU5UCJ7_9CYAN|nr:hypothetical protein [Nodularia harveyana]MEA5581058.1 hypothetical protein [Nodularia harveyana UHCC-0300]